MPESKINDQFVNQFIKGDASAFDELFKFYGPKLYDFVLKYLKSESETEELVQEVFVRVWENRKSLKTGYSFKSYLFTIALNHIRKSFNKRAIVLRYVDQAKASQNDLDNQTMESIDYDSMLQLINRVVEELPDRKKLIFNKKRKEGKTSKEIAEDLNMTVGSVDNQVSSAIKIIREALKNEGLAIFLFISLFLN